MSTTISTTIEVERGGQSLELTVTGTVRKGRIGYKSHPMDRFTPPDEPDELDNVTAHLAGSLEVTLTDDELAQAENALWDAVADD